MFFNEKKRNLFIYLVFTLAIVILNELRHYYSFDYAALKKSNYKNKIEVIESDRQSKTVNDDDDDDDDKSIIFHSSSNNRKEDKKKNIIVFITYSDHVNDGLCFGIETALMSGIKLNAIGVEAEIGTKFDFSSVKTVKSRKLFGFIEALSNESLWKDLGIYSYDSIIVLADASDVLYFRDGEHVMKKYIEIVDEMYPDDIDQKKKKKVVLIGAERNCWPYMDGQRVLQPGGKEHCEKFHVDELLHGSSYKYLNSGSLVGRLSSVLSLLREVEVTMNIDKENDDDQHLLQVQYLRQIENRRLASEEKFIIKLDHKSQIFQTGWGSNPAKLKYNEFDRSGAFYNQTKCSVENTEHGTEPAIVHFNGGKVAIKPIAQNFMERCFNPKSDKSRLNYYAMKTRVKDRYKWFESKCKVADRRAGLS